MKKIERLQAARGSVMERAEQLYGRGGSALAVAADGTLRLGDVVLTSVGAILPERMGQQEWTDLARMLALVDDSLAWWIGDLFAYGIGHGYGEMTAMALEMGFKPATVHQYKWVAESVEISRRLEGLSFGHHMAVAGLNDPDEQDALLRQALDEGWSVMRLRQELGYAIHGRRLSSQVKSQINGVRQALIEALHEFDEVDNRSMGMMLIHLGERYIDNE